MVQSAFKKNLRVYERNIREQGADPTCLWKIYPSLIQLCKRIQSGEFSQFQLNIALFGIFTKMSPVEDPDEMKTEVFTIKTSAFIIRPNTRFKRVMSSFIKELTEK